MHKIAGGGKEWDLIIIIGCKSLNESTNCLSELVGGYTQNGMDWVKDTFLDLYQNRR